jgi:hypothetical protein
MIIERRFLLGFLVSALLNTSSLASIRDTLDAWRARFKQFDSERQTFVLNTVGVTCKQCQTVRLGAFIGDIRSRFPKSNVVLLLYAELPGDGFYWAQKALPVLPRSVLLVEDVSGAFSRILGSDKTLSGLVVLDPNGDIRCAFTIGDTHSTHVLLDTVDVKLQARRSPDIDKRIELSQNNGFRLLSVSDTRISSGGDDCLILDAAQNVLVEFDLHNGALKRMIELPDSVIYSYRKRDEDSVERSLWESLREFYNPIATILGITEYESGNLTVSVIVPALRASSNPRVQFMIDHRLIVATCRKGTWVVEKVDSVTVDGKYVDIAAPFIPLYDRTGWLVVGALLSLDGERVKGPDAIRVNSKMRDASAYLRWGDIEHYYGRRLQLAAGARIFGCSIDSVVFWYYPSLSIAFTTKSSGDLVKIDSIPLALLGSHLDDAYLEKVGVGDIIGLYANSSGWSLMLQTQASPLESQIRQLNLTFDGTISSDRTIAYVSGQVRDGALLGMTQHKLQVAVRLNTGTWRLFQTAVD